MLIFIKEEVLLRPTGEIAESVSEQICQRIVDGRREGFVRQLRLIEADRYLSHVRVYRARLVVP